MHVAHASYSHAGHSNSQVPMTVNWEHGQQLFHNRHDHLNTDRGWNPGGISHSFCSYTVLHGFTGYRLRSTDLILKHLIVANSLVLLCKGVPQTMAVFGWKHIRSDFGCKLLFFLHRGRGVSIGSICLLSVFQVVMISPWNSRWAALKVTAPNYTVPSYFPCVGSCKCW